MTAGRSIKSRPKACLLLLLSTITLVTGLQLGTSSLARTSSPMTMVLGFNRLSSRRKSAYTRLPPNSKQQQQQIGGGKRTKLKTLRQRASRLYLGTSPSYMEYLDDLSGKKFRSYVKKPSNSTVDAFGTMVAKGDRLLGKIASRAMVADVQRRRRHYISDWTDAFKKKRQVIPGILFLYFACLSPAVSFGTIASEITLGNIGIVEFLLSSGLSGMAYAVLCGQPMSFIAPTGLTLAFISGLYHSRNMFVLLVIVRCH